MGSDGGTISGWSQCWQQQDATATMASGSPTMDYGFPPILPELHQDQVQYGYPHYHQPHPPQQEMGMPPSLSSTNAVVDPVRQQECQVTPVSTPSNQPQPQQLSSQSAEGHAARSSLPSCDGGVGMVPQPSDLKSPLTGNQSVPDTKGSSRSSLSSESSAATVDEVFSLSLSLLSFSLSPLSLSHFVIV